MEGITILKEIPVYQQIVPEFPSYIVYIALAVGLIIGAILGVIRTRKILRESWQDGLSFVCYIMVAFGMVGALIGLVVSGITYKQHEIQKGDLVCAQYEISVNDNVLMADVFDRYYVEDIISQEDLIFLVRDKSDMDVDLEKLINGSTETQLVMLKTMCISMLIVFAFIALGCIFSRLDRKETKTRRRKS